MKKIERILITKTPIAFLLNKSKSIILPGFQGVPLYDVIKFFYSQIKNQGISERASAISYNLIMAIPPSLLFMFTLIPQLPFLSKTTIQNQLHKLIDDIILSEEYNKEVIAFVDSFIFDQRLGLLSIGFIMSLFFASNSIMAMERSFNRKQYVGFVKRMGISKRLVSIKTTLVIFIFFLGYFFLLTAQGSILKLFIKNEVFIFIFSTIRWLLIILLLFFSIGYIFRYVPSVKKKWTLFTPGAFTTTFLSVLSTYLFSVFVSNFGQYNILYGSIGTIMMVMALIYINAMIILIGFELNVSINSLKLIANERNQDVKKEYSYPKDQ
ncbi:MAG: YihY/virulence factor BrkB family protein [Ferruginibacter sp.]|nr:YihY/virulence factor BrkB family protein [Ferruginibacter sp.]